MKYRSVGARAGAPGVQKRAFDQVVRHSIRQAVTQYLAGLDTQHYGQIQPTFLGWEIGDITDPGWREVIDGKLTRQHITCNRQVMVAVRGAGPETAFGLAPYLLLLHQPPNPFVAHRVQFLAQGCH
ncbi:hypothetical protein D3C84_490910 [compost metagenome]